MRCDFGEREEKQENAVCCSMLMELVSEKKSSSPSAGRVPRFVLLLKELTPLVVNKKR